MECPWETGFSCQRSRSRLRSRSCRSRPAARGRRRDLVVSAGHHGQGVDWLEQPVSNPASSAWSRHPISAIDGDVTARWFYDANSTALHHPEGLVAQDRDGDGDFDVAATELFFGQDAGEPAWNDRAHNVYVFTNQRTRFAPDWSVENVSPDAYPAHMIQSTDLNRDGRIDFIGEGSGFAVISYYQNLPGPDGVLPLLALLAALAVLARMKNVRRSKKDSRRPPGYPFIGIRLAFYNSHSLGKDRRRGDPLWRG